MVSDWAAASPTERQWFINVTVGTDSRETHPGSVDQMADGLDHCQHAPVCQKIYMKIHILLYT